MMQPIKPVKWYWVELNSERHRVFTIEPSLGGQWWICRADGIELVVTTSAFREECKE